MFNSSISRCLAGGLGILSIFLAAGCAKPFETSVTNAENVTKMVKAPGVEVEPPKPVAGSDSSGTSGANQKQVSPSSKNVKHVTSKNSSDDALASALDAAFAGDQAGAETSKPVSLQMGPTFSMDRMVACPKAYLSSVKAMEANGLAGFYNGGVVIGAWRTATGQEIINPRRICEHSTAPLARVRLNADQVITRVSQLFHMDPMVLASMDAACAQEVLAADSQSSDAAWVRGYAIVAYAKQWAAFEDGLKLLLNLRQQLDLQNPDANFASFNCDVFHSTSLRTYCQSLTTCLAPEQRLAAFERKSREIQGLIDLRQSLKAKSNSSFEKLGFFKGPAMESYLRSLGESGKSELSTVQDMMKDELQDQQKKLDVQIQRVNQSFDCLLGYSEKGCGEIDAVYTALKGNSPARIPNVLPKKASLELDLSRVSELHSCMSQWTAEVEKASAPFNQILAGLAVARFPGVKLFKGLSRFGKAGSVAAKSTVVGAGVGYSVYLGSETAKQCDGLSQQVSANAERMNEVLRKNLSPMSCQSSLEQFYLAEVDQWCALQSAISWLPAAGAVAMGVNYSLTPAAQKLMSVRVSRSALK